MRRLFTLGLIASTALSLALPAMAAPGDGRGRVAQQNGGGRDRGSSGDSGRTHQSAPPSAQRAAPAVQRSAPPSDRRGVQNRQVPPSAVGTQWRQTRRDMPRLGTGGGAATNWPDQRRAYDGNRRATQRPSGTTQTNRGSVTGNRWSGNDRRNDANRVRNDNRSDAYRWNNDRRTDNSRWNGNDRRTDNNRWRNNDRGSNWDRNNWNGRRLADRERWSEYRRWDNQGWRRDNRYNWQSYRSVHRDIYRMPRYYAPYGWNYGYSRFSIGIFLNSLLYANDYWIDDPYYYRLPPAYGYLRWIRYYDDALLVDIRDGYVVDVIHNFFW